MFTPKKLKYRKAFKGKNVGIAGSSCDLAFANYGVKVLENTNLKSNVLEAAYKVANKSVKATGKLFVRCFPHIPRTRKPIEVRMGKGKGAVDHYVARLRSGSMIFEFDCNTINELKKITKQCSSKIGAKCQAVIREIGGVFINDLGEL